MSETAKPQKQQYPWLTALRFVAALWVVVFHLFSGGRGDGEFRFHVGAVFEQVLVAAPAAVSFFFVLSGFVLTVTYVRDDALSTTKRAFWRARFARVMPLYWLSLVVAAPIALALWKKAGADPAAFRALVGDAFATMFTLQTWIPGHATAINPPAWSIAVEVFFYFLFPFVAPVLVRKKSLVLLIALWVCSVVPGVAYDVVDPDGVVATHATSGLWLDLLKYHPLVRIPELLFGVVVGAFFVNGVRVNAAVTFVAAVVFFACCAAGVPYATQHNGLYAPLCALIILGAASTTTSPPRFFVLLGDASYGLYLLHVPLLLWIIGIAERSTGRKILEEADLAAIAVAAVVVVSVVVFNVFEDPLRRRLR